MKAVILAGGYGTRISEESAVRPKPMVEIGGKPILWHIMKVYDVHGIRDFVIAAGYKGYLIKEYFANYALHVSDVTFDLAKGEVTTHVSGAEPWRITIVDTGEGTMTGGRLRRLADYVDDERFCLAYGDCVADIDVTRQLAFHEGSGAKPCGSRSHSAGWRTRASCSRTSTRASGIRWTRSGTAWCSRTTGPRATRPGRSGSTQAPKRASCSARSRSPSRPLGSSTSS
jgi:glucose-1-phosphate cytidylyltransferase